MRKDDRRIRRIEIFVLVQKEALDAAPSFFSKLRVSVDSKFDSSI